MIRKPKPGTLLTIAGAGHLILSSIGSRSSLADIVRHGIINTVSFTGNAVWLATIWSLIAGVIWVIVGLMFNWAEATLKRPVPARFGWALASVGFTGALIAPLSGFWSWGAVGLYAVWYAKKARPF